MTSLAMIHHVPAAWAKDKRLQGCTDIPLNDAGRDLVSQWRIPHALNQYRRGVMHLFRAATDGRISVDRINVSILAAS